MQCVNFILKENHAKTPLQYYASFLDIYPNTHGIQCLTGLFQQSKGGTKMSSFKDELGTGRYILAPADLADGEAKGLLLDVKGRAITRLSDKDGDLLDVASPGSAVLGNDKSIPVLGTDGTNYRQLKTDSNGRLEVVPMESSGTESHARGTLAAGSATLAVVTGATLNLAVGQHSLYGITVACTQQSQFNVVYDDGVTPAILETIILPQGGGTKHISYKLGEVKMTGSATALVRIEGMNINQPSDLFASISVVTL
jgi:hypothetical protein